MAVCYGSALTKYVLLSAVYKLVVEAGKSATWVRCFLLISYFGGFTIEGFRPRLVVDYLSAKRAPCVCSRVFVCVCVWVCVWVGVDWSIIVFFRRNNVSMIELS